MTMERPQPRPLGYSEVHKKAHAHLLRRAEIPVEHYVSLPLPTCRLGEPCYAFFASPALRRPGQPTRQGAPDRWFALAAHGARLLTYNLCRVVPFGDGFAEVELPAPAATIAELRQLVTDVDAMGDVLAPEFFADKDAERETAAAFLDALGALVQEPLLAQYRALAPDFFAWLEGGNDG